jgi:hypothetical protein
VTRSARCLTAPTTGIPWAADHYATARGRGHDLAATQRTLGSAVIDTAARSAEREALDGKPTSANPQTG